MPLTNIPLTSLQKIGLGIQRPEDVVVSKDGRVWASDAESACAEILSDGSLRRVGSIVEGSANGINLDLQGRIVIANFEGGPVHRLDPFTGTLETIVREVEGIPLTSSNYPIFDRNQNIWCANSTYARPWQMALDGRNDGMLFRIRPDGHAEKMADGIQFANGLALDSDESHIYVCETTGCDVVRYSIRPDGSLGAREQYGPKLGDAYDPLNPPSTMNTTGLTDGCGFDIEGNLWVTLVMANKVVAITPQGNVVTVIDDPNAEIMVQPTNVTWGGDDMCDLYIGSITSDYVLKTRSPIPGLRMLHQR